MSPRMFRNVGGILKRMMWCVPGITRQTQWEREIKRSLLDKFTKCNFTGTMKFEWDEEKRLASIAKHGVDFSDACRLFRCPFFDGA